MAENQPYLVSARKYRPSNFQSVVGQRALTATLKNAITGNRLAQAYLFCGPRGVGKTSCARIFAKTINCLDPTPEGEACCKCESCIAIEKGNSFNLVELDAASNNSVDDIRNITDQVNVPPQNGRYRVFIIDEVHMLSTSAFNAFLKTLEEPPKNVVFILATTERHKVIPTILSRCQIYDFRRITVNDIIDHLEFVAENEGVTADREALGVIAGKADGAMRDALSIFDQIVASTHGNLSYRSAIEALNVLDQDYYFKLIDIFIKGDVPEALLTFKEITDKGFDPLFFVNGLASHIRDLMVASDPRTVKLLETSEELAAKYRQQATLLPPEWYYKALQILNDCDYQYKTAGNKRLTVEIALIKLNRLLKAPFVNPDVPNKEERPATENKTTGGSETLTKEAPASPSIQPRRHLSQDKENSSSPASRKNSLRPTSIRISDIQNPKNASRQQDLNEDFTENQLRNAWDSYVESHSDQRILVSAMRGNYPSLSPDGSYNLNVSHPAQAQAFDSSLPEILDYLRQKLRNSTLQLNATVIVKDDEPKKMNPKEFLKQTLEDNPPLANFLRSIDAELE